MDPRVGIRGRLWRYGWHFRRLLVILHSPFLLGEANPDCIHEMAICQVCLLER
jgi:hypothetical protein